MNKLAKERSTRSEKRTMVYSAFIAVRRSGPSSMKRSTYELVTNVQSALFITNKHLPTKAGEAKREPLKSQREVARWWVGSASAQESALVYATLSELHEAGKWIGCSCMGSSHASPLFSTVLRDGVLGLRRMTNRPNHASTCPFRFEPTPLPSTPTGGKTIAQAMQSRFLLNRGPILADGRLRNVRW